jgi:hypothetical protein
MQPRRQNLILALAFVLAIAATIFFGVRAGRKARHIHEKNEQIRGWMSVPFIAHARHIHEEPLFRAIGVTPNHHDHRPIRDIAHAEHVPVPQLIGELESAIAQEAITRKESSTPR